MKRQPPRSTLSPNTTLFRSEAGREEREPEPVERVVGLRLVARQHARGEQQRGEPDRQVDEEDPRSEEYTSELQSRQYLVCRLLLEKNIIAIANLNLLRNCYT